MKLITDKGQLALPEDFSFDIEAASPLFGGEGTSSIPASLPATPDSLAKLGHPQRIAGNSFLRRMNAQLVSGAFTKTGQLVIDAVSKADGITASLALDASDIYAQFKDKNIRELFSTDNDIHNDYRTSSDPVKALYDYIYSVYTKTASDNFAVFPVAADRNEDDAGVVTYGVNNCPDTSDTSATVYPLLYKQRVVTKGDESISVPAGYGISVYLYLGKFIDLLFGKMGYTVAENPFDTVDDPPLSKIVLLNNVADTICKGYVNYGDIVPEVTVSEFLDFLEKRFNAFAAVDAEHRSVRIVLMQSALDSLPDKDITSLVNGGQTVDYEEETELELVPDTSLDGAEPAAATVDELYDSSPLITTLPETLVSAIDKIQLVKGNVTGTYLRAATGCYYRIIRKILNGAYDKSEYRGTNIFTRCRYRFDKQTEVKASDISAVMVFVNLSKTGIVLAPYVGDRIHRTTSAKGDSNSGDQKIILAYTAGKAVADALTDGKFYYGTTQKYNNTGTGIWCLYNLDYNDYYDYCWHGYDKYLQKAGVTVRASVDFPIPDLLSLDLFATKLFGGCKVLVKSLSYSVGDFVKCGESALMPVRHYDDDQEDADPVISEPTYQWKLQSNSVDTATAAAKADHPDLEFVDAFISQGSTSLYLEPPTAAGLTATFPAEVTVSFYKVSDETFPTYIYNADTVFTSV